MKELIVNLKDHFIFSSILKIVVGSSIN